MPRPPGIPADGDALRRLRAARGWTQEHASETAGVSVRLLRKAERGGTLDHASLALLAAAYSTPAALLAPHDLCRDPPPTGANVLGATPVEPDTDLLAGWLAARRALDPRAEVAQLCAPGVVVHHGQGESRGVRRAGDYLARVGARLGPPAVESVAEFGALVLGRWRATPVGERGDADGAPVYGVTSLRVDPDSGAIAEVWEYETPRMGSLPVAEPGDRGASYGPRVRRAVRGALARAIRRSRGWTQLDAALNANLSERSVRKVEQGGPVSAATVAALAAALSSPGAVVTPEDLLQEPIAGQPVRPEVVAMTTEWFDRLWHKRDVTVIDELLAERLVFHSESGVVRDREAMKERVRMFHTAFGDFDFRVERVHDLGAEIVCVWRVSMTHHGPWAGLAATGCRVTVEGASWIEVVGQRFRDAWDFWDPAVIQRQLTA